MVPAKAMQGSHVLSSPQDKYAGFASIRNPNRKWPDRTLQKPPVWLSADLRDGNQALVNPLTIKEKWEYFRLLIDIGFKEIEVSFPAASQVEFDFTRRLVEAGDVVPDDVRLRCLCPTRKDLLRRTVDALQGAKRAMVCTYICISDKQLRYQGFTREQAVQQAVDSVAFLRTITTDNSTSTPPTHWSLAFGLESFNEADHDFAVLVTNAVKEAWDPSEEEPMVVVLAASTEVSMPHVFADQVELFKAAVSEPKKIQISVHTHNDRGCGVAAAEQSMLAGADIVEGCLFGNGERSGNADLVTLALNFYSRGIHPGLDFSRLPAIREKYERLTGVSVPHRSPYAGQCALQAFSGGHQNVIRKGVEQRDKASERGISLLWDIPYLPIDPEDLGIDLDTIIRVNSQSGKAAAAWVLQRRWGLHIPNELQVDLGRRVQTKCELEEREITHEEVLDLFAASYGIASNSKYKLAPRNSTYISSSERGPSCSTPALIDTSERISVYVRATGGNISSAVVQGLNSAEGGLTVVAKIIHTERLCSSFGRGRFCTIANCGSAKGGAWGFFIDEDEVYAQSMAIAAAAKFFINSEIERNTESCSIASGAIQKLSPEIARYTASTMI
ncbi:2-isopropylmalate synthase [Colletotrichum somersetense]|nr:2-isopropylmalate synthase [Colletotrichum somersetense]